MFSLPDQIDYQAASVISKTHRLPDGRFEAVAGIFFLGKRGLTVYAVAPTRYRALKEAEIATETRGKLERALADGRVSYTAA